MPEATVNENNGPLGLDHQVRFARQPVTDAISQSEMPKGFSELDLGARIPASNTRHAIASLAGCEHVWHRRKP